MRNNRKGSQLDISEQLADNQSSIKNILNNKESYLSQFDSQTFDSCGIPGAANDIYQTNDKAKLADLERKLSYQGGWSNYNDTSMTYGIFPDEKLDHNNMVPQFSVKNGYGDIRNEGVMDYKNQLFTGNLKDTWKSKKEEKPMFSPMKDLIYQYGTPIYQDDQRDRCATSQYRQNETLFESIKVTPGLNLDYHEDGNHGFHPTYRPLGKTLEELRVNPKTTYEGRTIEGMRGQKRPIQAPVMSYKPKMYKTTTKKDMLPKSHDVAGPKSCQNFIMKETDRSHQHIEYTGGAYSSQESIGKNVPEEMKEKHKYAAKQNFTLPKPMQKYAKSEIQFNPNLDSYQLESTIREQTGDYTHLGTAVNPSLIYASQNDLAKSTLKEITSATSQIPSQIAPNCMRSTVHPMSIANSTLRELDVENKLNPHVTFNTQMKVYQHDIAKPTIKETLNEPILPANLCNENQIYTNWMDIAKDTIKETTVNIPRSMQMTPINQQQGSTHYTQPTKTTFKEINSMIPRQNMITPLNQIGTSHLSDITNTTLKETIQDSYQTIIGANRQLGTVPFQDIAKSTTKETIQVPYQTVVNPNQQQGKVNLADLARETMKETTVQTPWNNFIAPIIQANTSHLQDTTKTTVKETIQIPYQTMINPINQQGKTNLTDIAKKTMKESTVQIPQNHVITPINQSQRTPNYTDSTKITMKETLLWNPHHHIVNLHEQQRSSNYQATPETTMKELCLDKSMHHITPLNQNQRAANMTHSLANTMKETTVGIPRQMIMVPYEQYQRAPNHQDIAKSTNKEITSQISRNNFITPNNQHSTTPFQDIAKTTNKELSIRIPYNTVITPVNKHGTCHYSDVANVTNKETLIEIPYNTVVTSVGQIQGIIQSKQSLDTTLKETINAIPSNTFLSNQNAYQGLASSFNRNPLKITGKEIISQMPSNTFVNSNQYQGSAHHQDQAKTTGKELTIQIPYNTQISVLNQASRANLQDIAKTTGKESLIESNNNLLVNGNHYVSGKVSTFNRTPLPSTLKEETIDQKYIGMASLDTNGKGNGYISQTFQVPNTNKQFTCQEVYIKPLQGSHKGKSYNAAYRGRMDDRKEKLFQYRSPTNSNVNLGPKKSQINMELKEENYLDRDPILGHSFNNKSDRMSSQMLSKVDNKIPSDRFIDPILLDQLKSNPYHISIQI